MNTLGFKGIELTSEELVWKEINRLVDYLLTHPNTDPQEAKDHLKFLIHSWDIIKGCFYCTNFPREK